MSANRAVVGVTMGDGAGIGPEVILGALAEPSVQALGHYLVIGDAVRMEQAARILGSPLRVHRCAAPAEARFEPGTVDVLDLNLLPADLPWGHVDPRAGHAAFAYIERAVELAKQGVIDAIATAPLNKEALHAGGHLYPGHTEILADLTGTKQYAMLLVTPVLRVIHVTTHLSMRQACDRIKRERVATVIRLGHKVLKDAGIAHPRIAVAGLNPHAGEHGLFGHEEAQEIEPAVAEARAEGIDATGPWPGDTVFLRARQGAFDLVVAMYHDQGHIPVKLMGLETGVNVTVGLPIIRTSVDHGTAFDIAGTGKADPQSMAEALRLALQLAPHRR